MGKRHTLVYHCCSFVCTVTLLFAWSQYYYLSFPHTIIISLLVVSGVFAFTTAILPAPTSAILQSQMSRVIPTIFSGFGIAFFIILLFRIDYSRPILLMGAVSMSAWFLCFYLWKENHWKAQLYTVGTFSSSLKSLERNLLLNSYSPKLALSELKGGLLIDLQTPFSPQEERIIADCSIAQIPIYHLGQLKERLSHKVPSIHLSDHTLRALHQESGYFQIKNVLDFTLAILAITLFLPIFVVIALVIKFEGNGTVIFKQIRVGQHNQLFTLYKFRTMTGSNLNQFAKFASSEGMRITKLGAFLRKTRMDELPQFWNVLKGDMSIIGPRPEQPEFARKFAKELPFYNYRHIVKPGITGWAQVSQGYTDDTDSTKEKLAYDFYYLKHLSWQLDFEIYLKTIQVMITGKGAA